MTRDQIKEMILAILAHADYDLSKAYQEETAEEPETVEENMNALIEVAEQYVGKASKSKMRKDKSGKVEILDDDGDVIGKQG